MKRAAWKPACFKLAVFTAHRFAGNPAAVMLFESYPDEAICQALAAENYLAETAFLVPEGNDFRIRWFTPTVEVPLCGHATLASAAVVLERLEPARNAVVFHRQHAAPDHHTGDRGRRDDLSLRSTSRGMARSARFRTIRAVAVRLDVRLR